MTSASLFSAHWIPRKKVIVQTFDPHIVSVSIFFNEQSENI